MGFAVSGANTVAANDARALARDHGTSSSTGFTQDSATYRLTGLTPGSTTFTLQYHTTGAVSAAFANRNVIAIPLP